MARPYRQRMSPSKDKRVFRHTATVGKAINVKPRPARGGQWL